MKNEDRYDSIIRDHVERFFPSLLIDLGPHAWLWVKAQIWQESRMDPNAISPAGAVGLMQLMPATDLDIDSELDGHDVVGNIEDGVKYLATQYEKLLEISSPRERIQFALAAYNGGRGYVNKAMEIARVDCGAPKSFAAWKKAGQPAGSWQHWSFTHPRLADERCVVKGKRPDAGQICGYVAHIENRYRVYARGVA